MSDLRQAAVPEALDDSTDAWLARSDFATFEHYYLLQYIYFADIRGGFVFAGLFSAIGIYFTQVKAPDFNWAYFHHFLEQGCSAFSLRMLFAPIGVFAAMLALILIGI